MAGQEFDALTAARFEISIDGHMMTSSLQLAGISVAGARQFVDGEPVSNPADRLALARTMSSLIKSLKVS